MDRISRSWSMMMESWQVLRQDKTLLLLPFISGICCMMLMASFAIPIFLTGAWHPPLHGAAQLQQILYFGTLFSFYVANYFIVVFFNAALVACAATRMTGGEASVGDGLRMALSRLPVIIGWALVSATVGMILHIIEDRSPKIGRIVAGLLGMAWTLITFLVVPIVVLENKGPFAALKDSTVMLKNTWGEQVVSKFSFSTIFFLLMIPAFVLVIAGFRFGGPQLGIICCVSAVFYIIILSLVQSTLKTIFQTALYLYARDGHAPQGFSADTLGNALG